MARKKKAAVKVANGKKISKNEKKKKGSSSGKTKSKGNTRFEHGTAKYEHRKRDQRQRAAANWDIPPPPNLVAKLELPKHKSKYHSYFEFTENTEKKKKLEFEVTNDPHPQPGFKFVPIGDPLLTSKCKELSREHDAMIFIVSGSKETLSKVSEHVHRTGYQFREYIVDEAIAALEAAGETIISRGDEAQKIEPIPETQEEINKQADAAIRDLFPRIPNTDRQIIIDHAFQKGAMFHGEPVVGLQPDLPLYRRVQLAVLAHIRHNHTRYDKLLKETSWANARKVVEPVCLDFLVKWRGDEETGRDQMDEILREVVIITDSEDTDDSDEEEDSSDDDDADSSTSSDDVSQTSPQVQPHHPQLLTDHERYQGMSRLGTAVTLEPEDQLETFRVSSPKVTKSQRGFSRYRAAWEQAVNRRNNGHSATDLSARDSHAGVLLPPQSQDQYRPSTRTFISSQSSHQMADPRVYAQRDSQYASQKSIDYRREVLVRPGTEAYKLRESSSRVHTPSNFERSSSQVVRGSPSNGLKDMLVPSIEHERSSDATAAFSRQEVGRSRPPVIIIDDSPPQVKRRRIAGSSDLSRPVSPIAESYLVPMSSVRARNSPLHQSRVHSQSSQGLVRETRSAVTTAPVRRQLPIYDATPDDDFYFESKHRLANAIPVAPSHSDVYGQWEPYRPLNREGASSRPSPERVSGALYHHRQPVVQNVRSFERDHTIHQQESNALHGSQAQWHVAPVASVEARASRFYAQGLDADASHDFYDRSSQNRSDNHLYPTGSKSASIHGNTSYQSPQQPAVPRPPYPLHPDRSTTDFRYERDSPRLLYTQNSRFPDYNNPPRNQDERVSSQTWSLHNHLTDQPTRREPFPIEHEISHTSRPREGRYSRYMGVQPDMESNHGQPGRSVIYID